jgi:hypothetical protein
VNSSPAYFIFQGAITWDEITYTIIGIRTNRNFLRFPKT